MTDDPNADPRAKMVFDETHGVMVDPDNNLVQRGRDGDPLPDPRATAMIERESYERVIEGLKMCAEACMHLACHTIKNRKSWRDTGAIFDRMRVAACDLAGIDLTMRQRETAEVRGDPYQWRKARDRFLDGIDQAIGGMRQLGACFRGDYRWSLMAQHLERRKGEYRARLYDHDAKPASPLILPPGYVRH
jgi:hypothetical protein